jgi:fructose-bisphosphate aldolase, class I
MIKKLILPFLKNEKCLILAYDHGLGKNHEVFKFQSKNPKYIFELAKNIQATGIILNKGIAEIYCQSNYKTPLIIKLNSKSEKTNEPILTCSVKYAHKLGAKAVGYTIYFGSEYESEQIEVASNLIEEAHNLNMAIII